MEKNGHFLESGSYNGHYYGTPKPSLGELIMKDEPTNTVENGKRELEAQTHNITDNSTESIEPATVHRESENLNKEKCNGTVEEIENDNPNKKNNEPINV